MSSDTQLIDKLLDQISVPDLELLLDRVSDRIHNDKTKKATELLSKVRSSVDTLGPKWIVGTSAPGVSSFEVEHSETHHVFAINVRSVS